MVLIILCLSVCLCVSVPTVSVYINDRHIVSNVLTGGPIVGKLQFKILSNHPDCCSETDWGGGGGGAIMGQLGDDTL